MAAPVSTRDQLLTQAYELTKSHIEYDAMNRMQYVYTARTDAVDGEKCTRTEYLYRDATSTQHKGMKETNATWDEAWDADWT